MDALDLLFRRLVLAARAAGALARPLDVGEVLDVLVPFRSALRDGGVATTEEYLHTMMRLLAGERNYVFADELLQDDLRAELAAPTPDLNLLRTYLNATLRVATAAAERVLAGNTAIDLSPPTAASPTPRATLPAQSAARDSRAAPTLTSRAASHGPVAVSTEHPTAPRDASGLFQSTTVPPPTTGTERTGCPYCASALPDSRTVKYCPSCGLNLLVRRCPGCSAEIESGWRFCVTCGRSTS